MALAKNPFAVISGGARLEKPETTNPEQGLRRTRVGGVVGVGGLVQKLNIKKKYFV